MNRPGTDNRSLRKYRASADGRLYWMNEYWTGSALYRKLRFSADEHLHRKGRTRPEDKRRCRRFRFIPDSKFLRAPKLSVDRSLLKIFRLKIHIRPLNVYGLSFHSRRR